MKLIIAGSRSITDKQAVFDALNGMTVLPTEVVSGCAQGVDWLGELWAREKRIKIYECPADWKTHGKKAGFLRNRDMAWYADALIAFWDGKSRGTASMIDLMRKLGKPVTVIYLNT